MILKTVLYIIFFSTYVSAFNFEDLKNDLKKPIDSKFYESFASETCAEQLQLYVQGITGGKQWAMEMFDATSKLQSGILKGNLFNLGNFDECLAVNGAIEGVDVLGKYCLGMMDISGILPSSRKVILANRFHQQILNNSFIKHHQTRLGPEGVISGGLYWAACVPNSCNDTEITAFFKESLGLNMLFREDLCQSEDTKPELTGGAITTICLFAIVLALVICSTIYDVYLYYSETKTKSNALIAFSILNNGKKIIQISKNENQLLCLNGIKAISMMWVIIGHGYSILITGPIADTLDLFEWFTKTSSMYIFGATVSVDSFFLVGGLLTAYTFMSSVTKGIKFNIFLYYLHRYIRLTPALAVVVLVHAVMTPYLSSGPLYPSSGKANLEDGCKENWWSTLLYIQNYYNYDKMCIAQSWYLSVDMQLFIISPLLLIPLWKWPKWGISGNAILCWASIATCFTVGWYFKLGGLMGAPGGDPDPMLNTANFMKHYYLATQTRLPPYVIGILLGYCIFNIKNKKLDIHIKKNVALILWICSLTVLLTCVFCGSNLLSDPYNRIEHTLYLTFVRPAWSVALCWVIYACIFGYGGPVNWFLSAPVFQPLSKLSYSMYLVHYTIISIKYLSSRIPIKFSDLKMMHSFWGDFWFTLAVAVVWTLMFESPMITIEKIIFGTGSKKDKEIKKEDKSEIPWGGKLSIEN